LTFGEEDGRMARGPGVRVIIPETLAP
jgi:hypothetical protein